MLIGASLVFIAAFAGLSIPGSIAGALTPLLVLERLLFALPPALVYIAAGVGLGRVLRPLWRGATDELAIQIGVGTGLMLFLSHLLGCVGLLGGSTGSYVGLGVVGISCAIAAHQAFNALSGRGVEPRVSPTALVTAAGLALLLVAACNPPGALWRSEYGGYDVLEYHLQLPQEWLALGQLKPLPHNVYSYLPGYLEAAYLHIGAMTFAPPPSPQGGAHALLAAQGDRLISCQLLHACFAVLAAWLTARLARRLAGPAAAPIAFGLVLLTPWTIVTGSMAYNEMALVAMFAAGALAACETGLVPWRRALLVGLLAGIAASVKPTGLFMVGVPLAILLLGLARPREWPLIIGIGATAGLAMLAPWLLRNYTASGNPVFPFAASWFTNDTGGTGHWTQEQVVRYAAAHRFDGTILDRLRLLILPDPTATPSPNSPSTHRGLLHPQWALLFPLTLMAAIVLWFKRPRDLLPFPTLLLSAGLMAQLVLWLTLTHLQSRFLIPLVVPGAVLTAAATAGLAETLSKIAGWCLAAAPLLLQLSYSLNAFMNERAGAPGRPNQLLVQGPAYRTGHFFQDATREQLIDILTTASAELFINLGLPPDTRVMLLGDATPLYFTRPVIYQTTYDTHPLSGVEPSQWNQALKQLEVDLVLVNLSELRRLERSGWNAPGITVDAAMQWMQQHAVPVVPPQQWERLGIFLVQPLDAHPPAQGTPR